MAHLRLQVAMVACTMALFIAALALNEWLFRQLEFLPGINWIYLPAGVRLLSTLLFAGAGAVGLLLVSWLVSFVWLFPDDPLRAFAGGILATAAPYGVYLLARHAWGLQASLANLTPRRLLVLVIAYAVASPLLHHLWFALRGDDGLVRGFLVMAIGDLTGTLLVVYCVKGLLRFVPRPPADRSRAP